MKKKSTFSFLLEQIGNKKKSFVFSIITALLSVLCEMAPFYFVGMIVIDLYNGVDDLWTYGKLVLIILALFVLKVIFHCISTATSHKATFEILANTRKKCSDKLAKMPLGEVNSRPTGALKATMVERIDSMELTLAHVIPEMSTNIIPPIIFIISIFIVDWRMGFVSLITVPIGFICMCGMYIGMDKFFGRVMRCTKKLNDTSVEYINGLEVIKVFGKSESSYQKFVDAANDNSDAYVSWMKKCNFFFVAALVLMPATMVSVLPIGAIFLSKAMISLPEMIIIIILSVGMIEPFIRVMSYQDDVRQIDVIVGEIRNILDADELIRPNELSKNKVIKDSSISLKNVHFAYQEKEVLHGINLDIKAGEYVALVGPSGSGKSTIAKLIASMWDVKEGSISLGGVNIKDIPLDMYEDYIAYVSQDSYLFNTTVMENLKMGSTKHTISDEEVINICKECGVHEFIMSLENGYDTMVGSSGSHLSGGEMQRISIARAMIKDAPVVILDEATSYSDPENEAIIQESVGKLVKNKTLIVIAHRLSTIIDADKIVLVSDGNIIDSGTHKELLSHNGLYKDMWEAHISIKDTKEDK